MSPSPRDLEFHRRLRAREPEALGQLFDLHFDALYGYLRGSVRDEHVAEDLAQETFMSFYRNLESFDPNRALEPWLFTIAANKLRDHWRSSATRRRLDGPEASGLAEVLPAEEPAPEAGLLSDERASLVRRAVGELPPGMRQVLELRAFQGLSFEEIGDRLGRNAQAVRKRFSRGLGELRSMPALQTATYGPSHQATRRCLPLTR